MDKNDDILMDGMDERIEAFLRGEMSADEEAAFKQEIRQNPELRNRAMTMTSLIKGLHDQNSFKEANIIKENTAKSKVRPLLWWACSVAAVFAIFFGIYKDHRYRMLDAAVSPYYTEYDMSDMLIYMVFSLRYKKTEVYQTLSKNWNPSTISLMRTLHTMPMPMTSLGTSLWHM